MTRIAGVVSVTWTGSPALVQPSGTGPYVGVCEESGINGDHADLGGMPGALSVQGGGCSGQGESGDITSGAGTSISSRPATHPSNLSAGPHQH